MLQRGQSGDLFVLSWARVRRGSIYSELLMCGRGVSSILMDVVFSVCIVTRGAVGARVWEV